MVRRAGFVPGQPLVHPFPGAAFAGIETRPGAFGGEPFSEKTTALRAGAALRLSFHGRSGKTEGWGLVAAGIEGTLLPGGIAEGMKDGVILY